MKVLATVLDTAPLLINANLVPKKQGGPTSASKWGELQPVARLYCNSLLRILHDVADDELYEVLLEQTNSLVSYIAVLPQARKAYVKVSLSWIECLWVFSWYWPELSRSYLNCGHHLRSQVPYDCSAWKICAAYPVCLLVTRHKRNQPCWVMFLNVFTLPMHEKVNKCSRSQLLLWRRWEPRLSVSTVQMTSMLSTTLLYTFSNWLSTWTQPRRKRQRYVYGTIKSAGRCTHSLTLEFRKPWRWYWVGSI